MEAKCYLALLMVIVYVTGTTQGSKIAAFSLIGSPSHKEAMYGILEALSERGHSITYYTAFKTPKKEMKGLTEIFVEEMGDKGPIRTDMSFFSADGKVKMTTIMEQFVGSTVEKCRGMFENAEIRELINAKEPIFDVALYDILYHDCALPVISKASKAIITVSTGDLPPENKWQFDIPCPYSIVPGYMSADPKFKMSFMERLYNVYDNLGFSVRIYKKMSQRVQKIVDQHAPGLERIEQVLRKVPLIFINSHPVVWPSYPTSPMVKSICGIALKEKMDPMAKDLQDFVDGSGDAGFVYVSFGSIVPSAMMPMHAKKALLQAFSKIPQRVIWRFDNVDNFEIPKNIKLVKWVPQVTILAHPKIRAFVMHGGINGYLEAINFGVPCIVIPVFADQPMNALKMTEDGIAETLDWITLTGPDVSNALKKVINTPSYKENAVRFQKIFRDRLVSPKEEAAYWVEYVIRHEGSTHLRVRTDHLNLFQYLLLDIFGLLGAIVAIVTYVAYRVLKVICGLFEGNKSKKSKNE